MSNWQIYTGNYEKLACDVRLDIGEVVKNCWPNADKFMTITAVAKRFTTEM